MPDYKSFPLPDTAEGLTEAEILEWRIAPGDEVTVNQIIVEIETAKAAVELPCPWAGVVTELHVTPGETVQVGAPIITIDVDPHGAAAPAPVAAAPTAAAPAETAESEGPGTLVGYGPRAASLTRRARKSAGPAAPVVPAAVVSAAAAPPVVVAAPPVVVAAPPVVVAAAPVAVTATGLVPLAKPPVRKLAKDLGVDLRALVGSGAGGVITRDDVHAAVGAAPATAVSAESTMAATNGHGPVGGRRVPIKGVRKATAAAMVESAFTAPHVTEFLTVDVTPMMELRARLKNHPDFRDVKITPLTFAAKAVCLAARRTPDANASWDGAGGEIVYHDHVDLGIAAATPRGLLVPKVRGAQAMSLRELAVALEQLTTTAREGRTAPSDLVNGTVTITNVGVFGVDTGTPILNPGESAILALGAIRDTPWVVDGQIVVRKVCQLALSFDHRVVDGQQGSQFLADVGALLADPAMAVTY